MLEFKPSRTCCKCGGQAERKYINERDLIERKCVSCEYTWFETTIDKESNFNEGNVLLG